MKKFFVLLTLLCTLVAGTLFAEKHSLGFAALDVDIQGTNYTKVYYLIDGSPAAGPGGFQMGDTILAVDGQDMADKYWREIPAYTSSDKPTTFTFSILRNNQSMKLKITSVPASTLAGSKYKTEDPKKINPNLIDVVIPVSTNHNDILDKVENIVNKEVFVKIRYAGEKWWFYNKAHKLTDDGRFQPVNLKFNIDYTKTLYVEMVYKSTDGFWYGDYKYITGAKAVWGRGYNKAKLMIWHTFKRKQSDPDWDQQMGQKFDLKFGRVELFIMGKGFQYYAKQGYTFPESVQVQVWDCNGKEIFNKAMPTKLSDSACLVTVKSGDKDAAFFAKGQIPEKDITILFTINAKKNGVSAPITFKVRKTLVTGRNNTGMYLLGRVDEDYYVSPEGEFGVLRY